MSPNGIGALQFFYYNPTNLSIMSNSQNIPSLTIQLTNLATIPFDTINHFPALNYLDLSNNRLTNVPSNSFSGSSLVTVDISFNRITKLGTNAFQSTSSSPISFNAKNNSLASLDYDAFNLTSTYYISIDVSNNKITKVDEEFSKLIQASEYFQLNLSNNPLPCDSTVQWMSTFVICPPVAIILAGTELCPNGESLYDYLVPYAKCG
jgi:Leucine-rich repeat (LRR) protein